MTATPSIEPMRQRPSVPPIVLGIIAFGAVAVGLSVAASPLFGVAAAAIALGGVILLLRPEYAAATVAFLLWANVPVVAMRSHGVPKTLASAYLGLLLLPVARRLLIERRAFHWSKALPWALAYLAFGFLSTAFSRDPQLAFENVKELCLEGVLVFFLATIAVQSRESLRRVTWALMAAGAFMGSIALIQQLTGRFDSDFGGFSMIDSGFTTEGESGKVSQPRLAGPIGEKNRFGQMMTVLIALGVGLARSETRRSLARLAYVATALSAAGAALTFSRGNAVGTALLLGIMAMMGVLSGRQLRGLLAAGAILLLLLPQYRARLATIPTVFSLASADPAAPEPDGAILGRATEVIAAVLVYIDHPLLGVGPGLFTTYSQEYGNRLSLRRLESGRQAHTLFPHVAAEGGTLGLFSFVGLLVVVMVRLYRRVSTGETRRDQELARAYFLALAAYLLCGLFLHMAFIRYFWFLVGLASAAGTVGAEKREEDLMIAAKENGGGAG